MKRPRAVTVLAVLILLLGASNFVTGMLLISGQITFDKLFGQLPALGDMQQDFEQTMKVIIVLFSLLSAAVAWGLLALKNWARVTTRVFAVLGLLGALMQMIQAFTTRDAPSFLVTAVIGGAYYWAFYYLGQAPVRAAFVPSAPPGSEPQPPAVPGSGPTT
jgi:hypothetical protein